MHKELSYIYLHVYCSIYSQTGETIHNNRIKKNTKIEFQKNLKSFYAYFQGMKLFKYQITTINYLSALSLVIIY